MRLESCSFWDYHSHLAHNHRNWYYLRSTQLPPAAYCSRQYQSVANLDTRSKQTWGIHLYFHRLNKLTSVSSSYATSFNRQTEFLCYEIFPWNSNFPLFFIHFSIQYLINYKHQLFMLMCAHFTKTEIKWQVMLR